MSFANWLVGPVFLIPIVAICWIRIATEEKMMLEQFDEDHLVYAMGTGHLLPKIWLRNAQEQQTPPPLDIAPPRQ